MALPRGRDGVMRYPGGTLAAVLTLQPRADPYALRAAQGQRGVVLIQPKDKLAAIAFDLVEGDAITAVAQ